MASAGSCGTQDQGISGYIDNNSKCIGGCVYDSGVPTFEQVTELSRLPDPSTLLFGVRSDAPAHGEAGRREAVGHWSFLAGRGGYTVTPLDSRCGHGSATYCGDVDVDGLVYQVHRGPRRRVVQA